jgi:hypothetical protein
MNLLNHERTEESLVLAGRSVVEPGTVGVGVAELLDSEELGTRVSAGVSAPLGLLGVGVIAGLGTTSSGMAVGVGSGVELAVEAAVVDSGTSLFAEVGTG